MKIVCFGDTHGYHKKLKIPKGDVLIFSGDLMKSNYNEVGQLAAFNEWIGKFKHKYKIVIAGNHDWIFETDYYMAEGLLTNATYLCDSGCEVEGLKVWGSPVTPRFQDWAFNKDEDIVKHWDMVLGDTNILITHGPPYGILDRGDPHYETSVDDMHLGCKHLANTIGRLPDLKLHVFGHMHNSWGREVINAVQYVNCAKGYHPVVNPPAVVEVFSTT